MAALAADLGVRRTYANGIAGRQRARRPHVTRWSRKTAMRELTRWDWFAVWVAVIAAVLYLVQWLWHRLPPHDPPHDNAGGGPQP